MFKTSLICLYSTKLKQIETKYIEKVKKSGFANYTKEGT